MSEQTIPSEELSRVVHQGYKIPLLCRIAGCALNQNRVAAQSRGGASDAYDVPRDLVQTWLNDSTIRMSLDTTAHDVASGLRDDPVAFLTKYSLTDPQQALKDSRPYVDPIGALFEDKKSE